MSEMQIPDGISMADLQELAKKATLEELLASTDSNLPLCGLTPDQFKADIGAEIDKLAAKYKHPMFPKYVACELISSLIAWHNQSGRFSIEEDNDIEKAGAWFRDAGKLQAAISQLIEVVMPDDFIHQAYFPND